MTLKFSKIEPVKVKSGKNPAGICASKKIKLGNVSGGMKNKKNKFAKPVKKNISLAPIGHSKLGKDKKKKGGKRDKRIESKIFRSGKTESKRASMKFKKKKKQCDFEIAKNKDWTILKSDNGEKFALENLKKEKAFDFADEKTLIGLPEAGKRERWNFIELKGRLHDEKKEEKARYILDDYDSLQDLDEDIKKSFKAEYAVSPYVLNLKRNDPKESFNGGDKVSFFKKCGEFKADILRSAYFKIAFGAKRTVPADADLPDEDSEENEKTAAIPWRFNRILDFFRSGCNDLGKKFYFDKEISRPIFSFAILACLIITPVYAFKGYVGAKKAKGRVLGAAEKALDSFNAGGYFLMSSDLENAENKFNEADKGFQEAKSALDEINSASYNLAAKTGQARAAGNLIAAGKKAVEISSLFFGAFKESHFFNAGAAEERNFLPVLEKFNGILTQSFSKVGELDRYLAEIDEDLLPEKYISDFLKIKNLVSFVKVKMGGYAESVDILISLSAKKGFKRYLLIYQNNNEIRPTGGFIGSYSLIDVKDGKIVNIETPAGGSYDLQGGLLENIAPPEALRLLNSRWEFQDANWWPDFPASAKFISHIYEKSGGPSVDGVIAVNASLMEDILRVIGPVEMPDYGKTINADNFIAETQKSAELEYDKNENEPKKIISDLAPRIMEKLFNLENGKMTDILSLFSNALKRRDIQVFLADSELEEKIISLGWGGEMKDIKNRDYLFIADTNLGGRKTDRVISLGVRHETSITETGEIIDELTITKKHNGIKGDYFEGVNNVDYLRVYVPEGSLLIEAEGFSPPIKEAFKTPAENLVEDEFLRNIENTEKTDTENGTIIGESFGKTYFANWIQINPGEEKSARFKYKLPFSIMENSDFGKYSLYVQKQAGSRSYLLEKKLYYPEKLKTGWAYPGNPDGEMGEWIRLDKIEEDRFYGVIFTK